MCPFCFQVSEDLNSQFKTQLALQPGKQSLADTVSIKILNMGAWARTSERVPVTLPRELEDYIPEVEEFYKVSLFTTASFLGNLILLQNQNRALVDVRSSSCNEDPLFYLASGAKKFS